SDHAVRGIEEPVAPLDQDTVEAIRFGHGLVLRSRPGPTRRKGDAASRPQLGQGPRDKPEVTPEIAIQRIEHVAVRPRGGHVTSPKHGGEVADVPAEGGHLRVRRDDSGQMLRVRISAIADTRFTLIADTVSR
ncbi:MAG TPA: hypothetical protein VLJ86_06890, partial [Ramlibacter sp.]|nr:hypothetical protein [Ramlibacter sp.]